MELIRFEFEMPFRDQILSPELEWGDIELFYNPNVDYQSLAKRMMRDMSIDGPSHVSIKVGDRLVATWSRYNERRELLSI